jgi:hypothetical protein
MPRSKPRPDTARLTGDFHNKIGQNETFSRLSERGEWSQNSGDTVPVLTFRIIHSKQ